MKKKSEPTINDVIKKLDILASDSSELKVSLEALARITARGFENVDKKFEQAEEREIARFQTTWKEMSWMNDDISGIKMTLRPLVRIAAKHGIKIDSLDSRVTALEEK